METLNTQSYKSVVVVQTSGGKKEANIKKQVKSPKTTKRVFSCLVLSLLLLGLITPFTPQFVGLVKATPNGSPSLTVIMRHISIQSLNPPSNINQFVDWWVGNNSFGTNNWISILCEDWVKGILGWGYTWTTTTGTWWTWSYNQLKTLIDRFHYHGWKVIMESTNKAWGDHTSNPYINNDHPELRFTNNLGTQASGETIVNLLANYTSPDTTRGISTGERLIDVYTARLKQQISDGLVWDGWFGSDGWHGLFVNGLNFGSPWGDTPTASEYYSFSSQEISEWRAWTSISVPSGNNTAFSETFDTYSSGTFVGNNIWQVDSGIWTIDTTQYISSSNSLLSPATGTIHDKVADHISWQNYTLTYAFRSDSEPTRIYTMIRGTSTSGYILNFQEGYLYLDEGEGNHIGNVAMTLSSNTWYWVKTVIDKTTATNVRFRVRVWQNTYGEPTAYNLTVTDTSVTSSYGAFGFHTYDSNAWFDNITVTSIQSINWADMSLQDKRSWIKQKASADYLNWWNVLWARDVYGQMRSKAREANPDFVMYKQIDITTGWGDMAQACPSGFMNITLWTQYSSCDYYFVLQEGTGLGFPDTNLQAYAELGKYQAYVAGLLKSKNASAQLIAGIQPQYNGNQIPAWVAKQEYLAEIQTYVWVNGERYRAVNASMVWMQYPQEGTPYYFPDYCDGIFDWIKAIANLMAKTDLAPVNLGPTYVQPTDRPGGEGGYMAFYSMNYTFASFVDAYLLRNNPNSIVSGMNTLFFDTDIGVDSTSIYSDLIGCEDKIYGLFANGSLNVVAYAYGSSQAVSNIFGATGDESKVLANFKLNNSAGSGSSISWKVLTSAQITDPYANWIASGYFGNSYTTTGLTGLYTNASGFQVISQYQDATKRIGMGIYYNATSGRFVYATNLADDLPTIYVPRAIINRAVYWASGMPVNTSEPLFDMKVFNLSDGTILVPAMNHKDMGGSSLTYQGTNMTTTLRINASALNLGSINNYRFYWAGTGENLTFTDWTNVAVTLTGMADVLVIEPKSALYPPTYSNLGVNTTLGETPALFYALLSDDVGLSGFIWGWNGTGEFINETLSVLSGTSMWANKTKTLPVADTVVAVQWWFNDTDNQWGTTGTYFITTSGGTVVIEISQINVTSIRVDINTNVPIAFHARYNTNQSSCTSGTIYVNASGYAINGSGWATLSTSSATVTKKLYVVTGVDVNGETDFQQIPPNPIVTWDRWEFVSTTASDIRISVGASFELRYKIRYDFDDVVLDITKGSVSGFSWDVANQWWKKTVIGSSSVTSTNYDETYVTITDQWGLTAKEDVAGVDIITDKARIYYQALDDSRVDVGFSIQFCVRGLLLYDNHLLGSEDTVIANFGSLTWDDGNGWFYGSKTRISVSDYTFQISSLSEATYGIIAFETNVTNPIGIWDKLFVTFSASKTNPILNETVTISWTIMRQYDGSTVSSFYIDISRDGELWKESLVNSSITDWLNTTGSHTYDVYMYSIWDETYGLTTFDSYGVSVGWGHLSANWSPVVWTVWSVLLPILFLVGVGVLYVSNAKREYTVEEIIYVSVTFIVVCIILPVVVSMLYGV